MPNLTKRFLPTSEQPFREILKRFDSAPVANFKYSNRCLFSWVAKRNVKQNWSEEMVLLPVYLLDFIVRRAVSNIVAQTLGVTHQSTQPVVIQYVKAVYQVSHHDTDEGKALNSLL